VTGKITIMTAYTEQSWQVAMQWSAANSPAGLSKICLQST